MASFKRRPKATFAEQAVALAWGAWTELGVSGWNSTHGDWAIDPEPLIVFTAWLHDRDPRLRDEATDWCIRNWRHVSRARLRTLVGDAEDDDRWGEFAATVSAQSGVTWPGSGLARAYQVTGRSTLPPLSRPSLAWLRLRAMFGLGARSEILRCFLAQPDTPIKSVAALATETGYTKRNVSDECEMLERAGLLAQRAKTNRFYYSLARRAELEALIGELPNIRPHWGPVLNIARQLLTLEEAAHAVSAKTFPIHIRKTLSAVEHDIVELDIDADFSDIHGHDLWPAVQEFGSRTLAQWSIGNWGEALQGDQIVRHIVSASQR
jgi:hypothetical protein